MIRFKIWLLLFLSLSIDASEMDGCGDLYNSFVDKKKQVVNFNELGEMRDNWIKKHLDIHFDYEDGSNAFARTRVVKFAIIDRLKSEPSLYLDAFFMPTAIYELSRYWSFNGVDADTGEVFINMKKESVSFLFQDIEEYGMSTAIYVLISGNRSLIEAMYQPLGNTLFSLEELLPLYPELTGSDLKKFYSCRI
ncbi:hypothetical protein [Aliivibrio finisterrensis]|uniref:Uncharacterized protein n=1 Tax=Aliivibrio finisterrensis TaxID=511998 RepID=A0A6N6RPE5_9GAMM|nr:hypothetical protein [Aliivibrio finisterrensis]KAB2823378.1 hypothetical protein F8B77_15920 [Aliivibrio finisterrensis]